MSRYDLKTRGLSFPKGVIQEKQGQMAREGHDSKLSKALVVQRKCIKTPTVNQTGVVQDNISRDEKANEELCLLDKDEQEQREFVKGHAMASKAPPIKFSSGPKTDRP